MEHHHIAEHHLVEQYLLNELSPERVDEFEEHLFDCQACAADVKATAAFMAVARQELAKPEAQVVSIGAPSAKWGRLLSWKQAVPMYALAACLLVLLYQNAVVYPKLKSEVATLQAPEVLAQVSLVGGNSRGGGDVPSAIVGDGQSVELLVDIPTQERFSDYTCVLYSPSHELLSTIHLPAQETKDTVHIRVPAVKKRMDGMYSLVVSGNNPSSASVDLAQYRFELKPGPGH
jgi:hypothetical protein